MLAWRTLGKTFGGDGQDESCQEKAVDLGRLEKGRGRDWWVRRRQARGWPRGSQDIGTGWGQGGSEGFSGWLARKRSR